MGERIFKYLFNGQFNGQFNGPWAGAIHSFPGIPPIYRYVTHLPITIKRGFRETSGQRVFKYLFGEGVGRVRGWDSRGHQYPKKNSAKGLLPKKNSANGLPKKNSAEYPSPPEKYPVPRVSRKKTVQSTPPPPKISSAEYPSPENIKFSVRVSKRQEQCLKQKYTNIV